MNPPPSLVVDPVLVGFYSVLYGLLAAVTCHVAIQLVGRLYPRRLVAFLVTVLIVVTVLWWALNKVGYSYWLLVIPASPWFLLNSFENSGRWMYANKNGEPDGRRRDNNSFLYSYPDSVREVAYVFRRTAFWMIAVVAGVVAIPWALRIASGNAGSTSDKSSPALGKQIELSRACFIRKDPSQDSPSLGESRAGQLARVESTQGEWVSISMDSTKGWIHRSCTGHQ